MSDEYSVSDRGVSVIDPEEIGPMGRSHASAPTFGCEYTPSENLGQLYRLLIESVRDYAIFALDPQGRILTWNPGAEQSKGYKAEEILGCHFSIFYTEEEKAVDTPGQELVEAAERGRVEAEGWRLRKDGSRFWANVVITALYDQTGTLVGYGKVTRDMTERRLANQRAIEDARRLAEVEAANRAKSEFLAAMSHELRTPLNAIGGYVDILSLGIHGPISEQQHEDLQRIRRSQEHLLGIINDLLNFSRLEAGRVNYSIGTIALGEIIDAVRPMIQLQANAKSIGVEWVADREILVEVDRQKTEQILVNLLTNAVKFTGTAGQVRVSSRAGVEEVILEISDTGRGIAPEKLASIFEPFVQVGRSLASEHEGVGLGLAISREIARAMGGDLTVESEVDRGSTFFLHLPRGGNESERLQ